MVNLFELMQRAQGGEAVQAMARQFGLSQPQAESAFNALLPAFTVALQRILADPKALMTLMTATAQAQQQAMMSAATQAMGIEKKPPPLPGSELLTAFFGSNELTRAIAAQAASVSGLQPQLLQQMMPAMAAMLTPGLTQSLAESFAPLLQNWQAAGASGLAAYSDMLGRMMGGTGPESKSASKSAPKAETRSNAKAAPEAGEMPNPFNPEGFATLMGQMMGVQPPPPEPEPEPEPPPPPPTSTDLSYEALSQMVETGREVQDQQIKAMQGLFNKMMGQAGKG